jgi:hypothetical protein
MNGCGWDVAFREHHFSAMLSARIVKDGGFKRAAVVAGKNTPSPAWALIVFPIPFVSGASRLAI